MVCCWPLPDDNWTQMVSIRQQHARKLYKRRAKVITAHSQMRMPDHEYIRYALTVDPEALVFTRQR